MKDTAAHTQTDRNKKSSLPYSLQHLNFENGCKFTKKSIKNKQKQSLSGTILDKGQKSFKIRNLQSVIANECRRSICDYILYNNDRPCFKARSVIVVLWPKDYFAGVNDNCTKFFSPTIFFMIATTASEVIASTAASYFTS